MPVRKWVALHGAREIVLEYDWSWLSFKRHARLRTDGRVIANWSGSAMQGPHVRMEVGRLEARIAPRGPMAGGQIWLDGELIGGDRWIAHITADQAREWALMPFAQFYLRRGLPMFGLPFGVLFALFLGLLTGASAGAAILGAAVATLAYAAIMSVMARQSYDRMSRPAKPGSAQGSV